MPPMLRQQDKDLIVKSRNFKEVDTLMLTNILKSIITLEILGISYLVFRAICLYFKYRYTENIIENGTHKKEDFLSNAIVIEQIKNLKEIPYQGY